MYGEMDMWAKRQELQRELARLDLLAEAKQSAAEDGAPTKQARSARVPQRVRGLASTALSALRVLPRPS